MKSMNRYRLSPQRHHRWNDPVGYTRRRIASIPVVAGVLFGLATAGLIEAAGVDIMLAFVVGIGGALGVAAVASLVAASPSRKRSSLPRWARPIQLGPDPDQVLGRHTGART
jgi:hypothetical protein